MKSTTMLHVYEGAEVRAQIRSGDDVLVTIEDIRIYLPIDVADRLCAALGEALSASTATPDEQDGGGAVT